MDTQSQDAMDFFLFHSPVSWIALSMVKENGTGSCACPSNNNDPTEECLVKIKTGFLTKQVNVGSPKEGSWLPGSSVPHLALVVFFSTN